MLNDSELCPQNLALLWTSWVISYSSMALNTINILMTSQHQSLTQSSPLNTGSYSAASITCPFDSPAAIWDSTNSTHNSWFPFPTVYFLSQQMALPLTQLLWHQTWGHPWLTPWHPHSVHSKSCWSKLQNICYIWALFATSYVTILIQTR